MEIFFFFFTNIHINQFFAVKTLNMLIIRTFFFSTQISLQIFTFLSSKLRERCIFSGKNAIFQGGLSKNEKWLACQCHAKQLHTGLELEVVSYSMVLLYINIRTTSLTSLKNQSGAPFRPFFILFNFHLTF